MSLILQNVLNLHESNLHSFTASWKHKINRKCVIRNEQLVLAFVD